MANRKKVTFDDYDGGNTYVVVYYLNYDEFDDNLDDIDTVEIELNASDFDTAVRYAQQYLRKMQTENDTSESWKKAVIVSVEQF